MNRIEYLDRLNSLLREFDREYHQEIQDAVNAHFEEGLREGRSEEEIAAELGNPKCMNIVLFGAMTHALGMDEIDWEAVIRETVPAKFVELNLRAYEAGRAAVT